MQCRICVGPVACGPYVGWRMRIAGVGVVTMKSDLKYLKKFTEFIIRRLVFKIDMKNAEI